MENQELKMDEKAKIKEEVADEALDGRAKTKVEVADEALDETAKTKEEVADEALDGRAKTKEEVTGEALDETAKIKEEVEPFDPFLPVNMEGMDSAAKEKLNKKLAHLRRIKAQQIKMTGAKTEEEARVHHLLEMLSPIGKPSLGEKFELMLTSSPPKRSKKWEKEYEDYKKMRKASEGCKKMKKESEECKKEEK